MDKKAYMHNYYENNKVLFKKRALISKYKQRDILSQFVWDYLKEHPCVDCSESDPVVLEFDHKEDKENAVSRMITNAVSVEKLKLEIDKCEIRCANCHRRKTAIQLGWYKKIVQK